MLLSVGLPYLSSRPDIRSHDILARSHLVQPRAAVNALLPKQLCPPATGAAAHGRHGQTQMTTAVSWEIGHSGGPASSGENGKPEVDALMLKLLVWRPKVDALMLKLPALRSTPVDALVLKPQVLCDAAAMRTIELTLRLATS